MATVPAMVIKLPVAPEQAEMEDPAHVGSHFSIKVCEGTEYIRWGRQHTGFLITLTNQL